MGNTLDLSSNLEAAKQWLLYSGIQNTDKEAEINGGFNSWFDTKTNDYFYTYSEITGYGITTLLYLNELSKDVLFIERAKLAGDWLTHKATHACGGVRTRYYYNQEKAPENYSFKGGIIHSFDNGMVLCGLVNIYKIVKEQKYLDAAKKIADLLVDKMQKPNGLFYANYNPETNELKDSPEKWSTQSGSYHSKLALGLLNFYEITKDKKYQNSARKICDKALEFQEDSGRFVTYATEEDTHLHPHCYSAEGLWLAGVFLDEKKYLESASKAIAWALDSQLETGGIASYYIDGKFLEHERSDILAQILRLGVLLAGDSYKNKLENLAKRLASFQYLEEGKQKGSFYYGTDFDYKTKESKDLKHLNSWCTMFALQALDLYNKYTLQKDLKFDKWLFI